MDEGPPGGDSRRRSWVPAYMLRPTVLGAKFSAPLPPLAFSGAARLPNMLLPPSSMLGSYYGSVVVWNVRGG